jgi:hypothetical protein
MRARTSLRKALSRVRLMFAGALHFGVGQSAAA